MIELIRAVILRRVQLKLSYEYTVYQFHQTFLLSSGVSHSTLDDEVQRHSAHLQ